MSCNSGLAHRDCTTPQLRSTLLCGDSYCLRNRYASKSKEDKLLRTVVGIPQWKRGASSVAAAKDGLPLGLACVHTRRDTCKCKRERRCGNRLVETSTGVCIGDGGTQGQRSTSLRGWLHGCHARGSKGPTALLGSSLVVMNHECMCVRGRANSARTGLCDAGLQTLEECLVVRRAATPVRARSLEGGVGRQIQVQWGVLRDGWWVNTGE